MMTKTPHLLALLVLLGLNEYKYEPKLLTDVTCPFCKHKSHADKGCKSCSCKTGVVN